MKRNLSMVLAGLLVFVMASPLYAAPDIKVNGQIRTRLRYWVNINLDNDSDSVAGTANDLAALVGIKVEKVDHEQAATTIKTSLGRRA